MKIKEIIFYLVEEKQQLIDIAKSQMGQFYEKISESAKGSFLISAESYKKGDKYYLVISRSEWYLISFCVYVSVYVCSVWV